jgi:hypothetical protein
MLKAAESRSMIEDEGIAKRLIAMAKVIKTPTRSRNVDQVKSRFHEGKKDIN